jgi:hypothetical protein
MNGRNLRLYPQHGLDSAVALVFGQLSYVEQQFVWSRSMFSLYVD